MMKSLTRTKYRIIEADFLKYLRDYQRVVQRGFMPKYHAIFADPPYFLGSIVKRFGKEGAAQAVEGKDGAFRRLSKGFMGQTWDGFESPQEYQAWVTAWAEILLDFVYPGAVLAMFGGSRTYHRLVCGLEDAGWEIYDSVANWCYSQGFPKNHDLGDGYGTALKPANEPIVIARAPRQGFTYKHCFEEFGTSGLNIDECRISTTDVLGGGNVSNGKPTLPDDSGWHRPWMLDASFVEQRKEIQKNRVAHAEELGRYPANFILSHHPDCNGVCHADCHVRHIGEQSGIRKSGSSLSGSEPSDAGGKNAFGRWNRIPFEAYNDEGTAARFFYQAKPAVWEKDAGLSDAGKFIGGNTHPTVKSIQLNEYICRLIAPPKQKEPRRLMIPFSGVASEMIGACLSGGFEEVVGIEMTADYIPIAKARLAWWTRFETYAEAEAHYKQHDPSQMTLFEQPKKAEKQVYQPSLFEMEAM
jgi:site-specific DNA-methyltransferase (adenine-specific)